MSKMGKIFFCALCVAMLVGCGKKSPQAANKPPEKSSQNTEQRSEKQIADAKKKAAEYRVAAEKGDAESQLNLGVCYFNGNGVEKDLAEAVKWYRKAAEQGLKEAQYQLAQCYENGRAAQCVLRLLLCFFGGDDRHLHVRQSGDLVFLL